MLKYILPLTIIALSSCLTYWISPAAVPARVSLAVSLLLATITLNFVIQSELPKVNYSTNLDTYIALVFIFVFIALIEFSIVHFLLVSNMAKISEKVEQAFRLWAPLMIFHCLVVLLRSGHVTTILKSILACTGIIISIGIIWVSVFIYRKERKEEESLLNNQNQEHLK
jgi:hypothetical protein